MQRPTEAPVRNHLIDDLLPLKAPWRINLIDEILCMPNGPLPEPRGSVWQGHDAREAFKYYTSSEVLILAEYASLDEYQGEYYIIFEYKGFIFTWRGSFGTCDGCDMMEGSNKQEGYETIKWTLSEGNTLQFRTLDHAKKYMKLANCNNDSYLDERRKLDTWSWMGFPLSLFDEAEDTLLIHSSRIYRDDFVKKMLDAELDVSEPLPIHTIEDLWEEKQNE